MIGLGTPPVNDGNDRDLLVPVYRGGEVVYGATLDDARRHHAATRAELPDAALRISKGDPALETIILDEVGAQTTNPYQAAPVVTNL